MSFYRAEMWRIVCRVSAGGCCCWPPPPPIWNSSGPSPPAGCCVIWPWPMLWWGEDDEEEDDEVSLCLRRMATLPLLLDGANPWLMGPSEPADAPSTSSICHTSKSRTNEADNVLTRLVANLWIFLLNVCLALVGNCCLFILGHPTADKSRLRFSYTTSSFLLPCITTGLVGCSRNVLANGQPQESGGGIWFTQCGIDLLRRRYHFPALFVFEITACGASS